VVKKVNARSTKSEIWEAYQEALKEKKMLERQAKQPSSSGNGKTATPEIQGSPLTQEKLDRQQIQDTIELLMQLKLGFGGSVSQLSEKLTREASKLGEVGSQVAEEVDRLQQLHELSEIEDNTLDRLVREYEDSSKTFSEEFEGQRETLEQEFSAIQQAWEKERETRKRSIEERNLDYQKLRQRDEREYCYDRELQRNTEAEEYQQQQSQLYRDLEENRQQQEKAWEEREKSISEREKEFEEVKAKVEAFPAEKEAQVKRGKEVGRHIATAQAKNNANLRQKEVDGEKQRYELQVQGLEAAIRDREFRIANLTQQLDATLMQVQELAVKAIEGAANEKSLQAVKDIALEQAKNQPRGK